MCDQTAKSMGRAVIDRYGAVWDNLRCSFYFLCFVFGEKVYQEQVKCVRMRRNIMPINITELPGLQHKGGMSDGEKAISQPTGS